MDIIYGKEEPEVTVLKDFSPGQAVQISGFLYIISDKKDDELIVCVSLDHGVYSRFHEECPVKSVDCKVFVNVKPHSS